MYQHMWIYTVMEFKSKYELIIKSNHRLTETNILGVKCEHFLIHQLNICLGAQKNRLIRTVLLSTHNICLVKKLDHFQVCTIILRPASTTL